MKKLLFLSLALLTILSMSAQNRLVYQSYTKGSDSGDTTFREVLQFEKHLKVHDLQQATENTIPGISDDFTYINYENDSAYSQINYPDGKSYFCAFPLSNNRVSYSEEGTEKVNGYKCKKYRTSINSNTIEVWMTESLGYEALPTANRGYLKGVMVKQAINGNRIMELKSAKKDRKIKSDVIPNDLGERKTYKQIENIRVENLVVTIPVFDEEQVHFAEIERFTGEMPLDTAIHFSYGTIILKKMSLPKLPDHYRIFVEMSQHSNGDAYDRSGSVFVIPTDRRLSFMDALTKGIGALPFITGKDGKKYQGIRLEENYEPLVELVRFFTPFGVRHFNDRVSIDGLEWDDEAYFKMDVTEIGDRLQGDVLIGAFIGNYDGGGHKLSMKLKAYPEDVVWNDEETGRWSLPLFNTCNVMEMSGQNYGRLFYTDSLTVNFEVPEGIDNLRLRYISTGHGGWDGGDEFNPKENAIFVDGVKRFVHTPWRCDCATYREMNPVSGNFWNGVSSSDYSRSGWCPGTAANPVYFDLNDLKPGFHTMTIAIPQGSDEGDSFSHWMVSGILTGEKRK